MQHLLEHYGTYTQLISRAAESKTPATRILMDVLSFAQTILNNWRTLLMYTSHRTSLSINFDHITIFTLRSAWVCFHLKIDVLCADSFKRKRLGWYVECRTSHKWHCKNKHLSYNIAFREMESYQCCPSLVLLEGEVKNRTVQYSNFDHYEKRYKSRLSIHNHTDGKTKCYIKSRTKHLLPCWLRIPPLGRIPIRRPGSTVEDPIYRSFMAYPINWWITYL